VKKGRKKVFPCVAIEQIAVAVEDPLDVVLAREQTLALKKFIELLPPRQRQVVCMYYLWGWRQAKIARKLGIPRPNVLHHRKAAMKNLRAFLGLDCNKRPSRVANGRGNFLEVGSMQLPSSVRHAFEEAACEAESANGEGGFLFADVMYRAPSAKWTTPFTLAYDKQAYLDRCFGDNLTKIPKGVET
jgi:hypothetical protein